MLWRERRNDKYNMNNPKSITTFIRYQLPVILWAAVIFVASSIPNITLPKIEFIAVDKAVHTGVFYVFALLFYRAINKGKKQATINMKQLYVITGITMLYGISDEVHQLFVLNRFCDMYDMIADTLGGVLASLTVYIAYKYKFNNRNNSA